MLITEWHVSKGRPNKSTTYNSSLYRTAVRKYWTLMEIPVDKQKNERTVWRTCDAVYLRECARSASCGDENKLKLSQSVTYLQHSIWSGGGRFNEYNHLLFCKKKPHVCIHVCPSDNIRERACVCVFSF